MGKIVDISVGLRGRFNLTVKAANGEIKRDLEFSNVITNYGLDAAALEVSRRHCSVGTGTTPEAPTDQAMENFLASASRGPGASGTSNSIDQSARVVRAVYIYEFPQGAAAGNLSEVGISVLEDSDGTNLWSRSLIKDSNGDPTTITVLSNEVLTVTYILEVVQPPTTVLFEGTISGYPLRLRAAGLNSTSRWNALLPLGNVLGTSSNSGNYGVSTSDIERDAFYVSPNSGGFGATSVTPADYVPGTHYRDVTIFFDVDRVTSTIYTQFAVLGVGAFQVYFPNGIDKDNTKEYTITMRFHWAREGEL